MSSNAPRGTRDVGPVVRALRDVLIDGRSRSREHVLTAAKSLLMQDASNTCLETGLRRHGWRSTKPDSPRPADDVLTERGARWLVQKYLIKEIDRGNIIADDSGHLSLTDDLHRSWRTLRTADFALEEQVTVGDPLRPGHIPPLVVNSLPESRIWALAPSDLHDMVHWRFDHDFDLAPLLAYLPAGCAGWVGVDDLIRVWTPLGEGDQMRVIIREWCAHVGLEPRRLRVERGTPFRDLTRLPDNILSGIIDGTLGWLERRGSRLAWLRLVALAGNDHDEARQLVRVWVLEMATKYQENRLGKGEVPLTFTAFCHGKFGHLPTDLDRKFRGNRIIDDEVTIATAYATHLETYGRVPTDAELAEAMSTTVADARERRATVAAITAQRLWDPITTGGVGSGDDEWRGHDIADDTPSLDANILGLEESAALTKHIVQACVSIDDFGRPHVDPLGLTVTVLTLYHQYSQVQVASILQVASKTVASANERVYRAAQETLREALMAE